MGALNFFQQANEVDVKSKYLIYMAIPLNLLLWGCKSWARTKNRMKNQIFHMRCLGRILDIKWSDVVDNKISNKKVRTPFNNITKVESLIVKRRSLFVGKIIRMPCKKIPVRLISAFIYKKRTRGRPNTTVRHSILDDIGKNIPSVDKYGSFNTWAHIANN